MAIIKQFKSTKYYVSDSGDVYRKLSSGELALQSSFTSNNGYQYCPLQINGTRKTIGVHRLVLHCFGKYTISEAQERDLQGLHLDDDTTNNTFENLRWGTRSENELMKSNWREDAAYRGKDNKPKKYGPSEINSVKRLYRDAKSMKKVSELTAIPYTSVWNIINVY